MELSKSILNTLRYFDLFEYPLTLTELWQFLFLPRPLVNEPKGGGWPNSSPVPFNDVAEELELLQRKEQISFVRGFYCLLGREQNIDTRRTRHRISIQKMCLARREARWLMAIPGVVGVAVSNSLSYRNSRQGGDIDFFIITKDNNVWQSRFLAASYAALFDKRPKPQSKENKLCLCLFASLSALDLEAYLLPPEKNIPDVVRIYWMATLKPLAGDEQVWEKFYGANQWINNFLPNFNFLFKGEKEIPSLILPNFFEKILSNIQIKLLPDLLKQRMGQGSEVVTSFKVIKLHQNNGRSDIREQFIKKYVF